MCRHSYSLSYKKSEQMFWIVTWPISHRFRDKRRFPSKIANFSHPSVYRLYIGLAPVELGIGLGSLKASFNPAVGAWSQRPANFWGTLLTSTRYKNADQILRGDHTRWEEIFLHRSTSNHHSSVCISVPLWQIRIFGYFLTPNPDIRILSGFLCAGSVHTHRPLHI